MEAIRLDLNPELIKNMNIQNILNESFSKDFQEELLESSKYSSMDAIQKADVKRLFENTQNFLNQQQINEGTMTADIAQFTPILLPIVRRNYPNLVAHEILGVQPMSMPTGYIYAWVNKYIGDGNRPAETAGKKVVLIKTDKLTDATLNGSVDGVGGILLHKEENGQGVFALVANPTTLAVGTAVGSNAKIVAVYTNEATFLRILTHYTGSYSTAAGEVLGKDMKELGFEVTKKAIEVQTRKVKTPFTMEMYQDLKNQHGQLADNELINLASNELQAEIDRECIEAVNSWSRVAPNSNFTSTDYKDMKGRWEIERYRAEAVRIDKEAALIGQNIKNGSGANTLIVSPKVAVMLRQLDGFALSPKFNQLDIPAAGGVAGIFDGRYKVIVDQYATNDYCTVLYKGNERTDAIGFYAPYVPISFTRVQNPDTAQPAIVASTRYALTAIPGVESANALDRAQTYATTYGIDFSKTVLA